MTTFDLAKQYYPRLWPENRILALVEAGRLSKQEADEIMGRGPEEA